MANNRDFIEGNIKAVIVSMAIPMILSQLVNVTYSLVDRMFIGHIEQAGELALTGIGLVMPVIYVVTAFACLFGNGGAAAFSLALGSRDKQKAEWLQGNSFSLIVLVGISLSVLIELKLNEILRFLGTGDSVFPYAYSYGSIYAAGTVFAMAGSGMNYFINAQGFAKTGMTTVIIGAVTNIVLDYILIFKYSLGIEGAAIATVIAQVFSAIWVFAFLMGKKPDIVIRKDRLRIKKIYLTGIVSLGLANFTMNITACLVQLSCNLQLGKYGGGLYIGAMTVINSVREAFVAAVQGITLGSQPVLGYNYGAKAYDRVKEGIRFVTYISLGYAFVIWIVVLLLPGKIALIFNNSPDFVKTCVPAMKIYFSGFIVLMLQLVGQNVFVGLGKHRQAIFFSLLRKAFIVLPLVYILPGLFGLGADGVFISEPISNVIGGLACYGTMYFTIYKKL